MTTLEELQSVVEERVIAALAALPRWHSMQRRAIQRSVYGTDKFGASHVAAALGRLRERGVVVEVRRDVYRLAIAHRDGDSAA